MNRFLGVRIAQRVRVPDPLAERDLPPMQQGLPPEEELNELFDEVDGNAAAQIRAEVGPDGPPPPDDEDEIVRRLHGARAVRELVFARFVRNLREAPAAVRQHRLVAAQWIIKCWRQSRRRFVAFILSLHVQSVRRRMYAGSLIVEWAGYRLRVRHGREAVRPKLSDRWSEVWPPPVLREEACVVDGVVTADLIAELKTVHLADMVFSFAPVRPSSWGCATEYDFWHRITRVYFGNHTAAIEFKSIGFRIVALNAAAVSWIVRIVLEGYVGSPVYDLHVHSSMDCRERVNYLCGRRDSSYGHTLSWSYPTDDTTVAVPQVPCESPAYEVVIDDYCMCLTPRMREGLLLIHRFHEEPSSAALMELMRGPQGLALNLSHWIREGVRVRRPSCRGALPSRLPFAEMALYTTWRTRTFTLELPVIGMSPHGRSHRWGSPPLWKRHRAARHLTQAVRRAALSEVSRAIIEAAIADERDSTGEIPEDRYVDVQSAMMIERELHMGCALTVYGMERSGWGEGKATLSSILPSVPPPLLGEPWAFRARRDPGDPHDYVMSLPQIGLMIRGHNPAAIKFLFFWAAQWDSRSTRRPTRYDYVYVLNLPGYRSSDDALRVTYYPRSALYETDRVTIKWGRRHPTYVSARPGARSPTRGYVGDGAGSSSEHARVKDVAAALAPLSQTEEERFSQILSVQPDHGTMTEEQVRRVRELLVRHAHTFASAEDPASLPTLGVRTGLIAEELIEGEAIEAVEEGAIPPPPLRWGVERPQDMPEEDAVEDLTDCTCPSWCALHDLPLSCGDVHWTPAGARYFEGPFTGRGKPRDSGRVDAAGYMIAVDGAEELIATGYAHEIIMALHHSVRPGPFHYHYRHGCLVCQIPESVATAMIEFATWYLEQAPEVMNPPMIAGQSTSAVSEGDVGADRDDDEEQTQTGAEQSAAAISEEVSRVEEDVGSREAQSELSIQMVHALRLSAIAEELARQMDVPPPTPPVSRSAAHETEVRVEDEDEKSEVDESEMSWRAAHEAAAGLAPTDEERGLLQMHADDPEAQEAWAFRDDEEEAEDEMEGAEDEREAQALRAREQEIEDERRLRAATVEEMLESGVLTRVVDIPWATARLPNGALDFRATNLAITPRARGLPRAVATVEDEVLRPPRVVTVEEDEAELRWTLRQRAGQVPPDLMRAVMKS